MHSKMELLSRVCRVTKLSPRYFHRTHQQRRTLLVQSVVYLPEMFKNRQTRVAKKLMENLTKLPKIYSHIRREISSTFCLKMRLLKTCLASETVTWVLHIMAKMTSPKHLRWISKIVKKKTNKILL